MTCLVQRLSFAVAATCLLFISLELWAEEKWIWKDRESKTRTREELERILERHELWLRSCGEHGNRADLSGMELFGADLHGAFLIGADLHGANLREANLSDAYLSFADLRKANLADAKLIRADLGSGRGTKRYSFYRCLPKGINVRTDLRRANLLGADLTNAELSDVDLGEATLITAKLIGVDLLGANLSDARLGSAKLSGAYLRETALKGAQMDQTDLRGAVFEPESIPYIGSIAAAKNIEFLTYESSPNVFAQLRKQFQDGGFRTQERKITYALNQRRAALDRPFERWVKRVAFDLTCQYGMNPWRSLKIWFGLWFLCSLVYAVYIHLKGQSGIYRVQSPNGHEERIYPRPISSTLTWRYLPRVIYREWWVFFWAGFFSLMSAFNIGFREINFGRWLRLLARTEYDLKARGWARTVAGFQSLISVYLIALWVLTYFGRPFE